MRCCVFPRCVFAFVLAVYRGDVDWLNYRDKNNDEDDGCDYFSKLLSEVSCGQFLERHPLNLEGGEVQESTNRS